MPQRRPLRNFLKSGWRNQARAIEAMIFLAIARGLIRFVPFRLWKNRLGTLAGTRPLNTQPEPGKTKLDTARNIGQIVRRAAAHVPFQAVCLPQALAARWMLELRKIPNQLYIGARANPESRLIDLHAWLEVGELTLTGKKQQNEFAPFSRTGNASGSNTDPSQ